MNGAENGFFLTHVGCVSYDLETNAIHFVCDCGWTKRAGERPTVTELVELRQRHLEDVARLEA